jgi:hypothetical protein
MLMAMQVNENYDHSRTDYAERVKKKQVTERAEKQKTQSGEAIQPLWSGKWDMSANLQIKRRTKKWIRIISIYSIIYTVITLLNSVLYLCNGIYEDPSGNWHELDRAMILLIGIATFELCTNLPVKPLVLRYLIAYIPSQLLAFAYVWFSGLRESLAKTAYRDIWINFTSLFVLLCIINTAVYIFKKKREQEGKGRKE